VIKWVLIVAAVMIVLSAMVTVILAFVAQKIISGA
jgi:hypothetical protein